MDLEPLSLEGLADLARMAASSRLSLGPLPLSLLELPLSQEDDCLGAGLEEEGLEVGLDVGLEEDLAELEELRELLGLDALAAMAASSRLSLGPLLLLPLPLLPLSQEDDCCLGAGLEGDLAAGLEGDLAEDLAGLACRGGVPRINQKS